MGELMLLSRRRALAGCGGAILILAAPRVLTSPGALAQAAYPNRTIKIIVPYLAGGTTDFLGHVIADQLKTGLGATVVVENMPGAATTHGAAQVAIVGAQPDMDWSISADGFYVYPRSNDTVIGGTAEHHVDTETTDRTALSLLVRANRRILPHLSDASILRSAAGLRPFRDETIRVEAETVGDRRIVHNYGHGGAGITLSWGSAELALDLALT